MILSLLLVVANLFFIRSDDCIFETCLCSINSPDNSYDVKCIYDINSGSSNVRFPSRRQQVNFSMSIREINIMLVNRFSFKRIPDYSFANLSIRTLILAENDLEVLNRKAFTHIAGLKMLHIIEKKLKQIEPGAFEPLGDKLNELGLIELFRMSSNRIDELFRDVLYLERLGTFKLNHMKFNFFKDEWMASLGNLSYLSLASNNLKNLSVDLFEFSSSLISLDLNYNQLDNIEALFTSFQPIQANLKELKLKSNGIAVLKDFPEFENLEFLDLSKNKLTWISDSTFKHLRKLNYLHLNSNSIRTLQSGIFSTLKNLLVLNLANNHLNSTPNILELVKLQSLDISNQNGNLNSIDDFAFERFDQSKSSLSIDLSRNHMIRFGERSFCSRYANTSQIYDLTLTYATVKNMNRCVWRQLGSLFMPRVSLKVVKSENDGLIDFSDVCNCQSKAYALAFNVELAGLCSTVSDAACFAPNSAYTRLTKEEFICDGRFICHN